jgi:hypothetical protein
MNQNIKNMRGLTFLMAALTVLLAASCQKKAEQSNQLEFKNDFVEVEPFSPYSFIGPDQSYLKVIDGSNFYFFNNVIPDTLGYAVDTINKFQDINGNIVDTLWLTKDYAVFPDTTADGMYEVFIPVEKYNLGHNTTPFNFTYNVKHTISGGGSLDLEGDYTRSGSPVHITKISQGNFVLDNAFVPPRITPVLIYVDGSNTITIPDVKTGFYGGSTGALTIRQAQFYDIRYAQIGGAPGAGDTLVMTVKRTDLAGAVTRFIRQ